MKESPAETRQPADHTGTRDEPVKPAAARIALFLKANAVTCAAVLTFAAVMAVTVFVMFPNVFNEAVEAQTLAVLELSDTEIKTKPLDDLTDLRTYVDVYASNEDADPAVADKAARILDTAIAEHSSGR